MDDHHDDQAVEISDAPTRPSAGVAARDLPPVRHLIDLVQGGEEKRAPQYAYQAVTIVNHGTETVYASALAAQAGEARDGSAVAAAVRVPPRRAVTAPIAGRELYLAASGQGRVQLPVYRWATPQPYLSQDLGSVADVMARAFADVAAGETDALLVPAVTGKRVAVHQAIAIAGGVATTLRFKSKPTGAGSAVSPLFNNGVASGEVLPYSPAPWIVTLVGQGLAVDTGAGSATGILIGYALID